MDELSNEVERARIYLICRERGHAPGNIRTASNPPQDVCRWCGTYYWTETVRTLHEGMGKPTDEAIETARALKAWLPVDEGH